MATSQKDQIQSLIADIEQALGKERPKTPWVKTSETQPQREALARAQAYLMSLQQSFDAPGGWGPVDPSTGQIAAPAPGISAPPADASAENVLQALLTEMKFLKSSALEPLRLEMDSLRKERDTLNEEVKGLAEKRNQVQQEVQQGELAIAQQGAAQVVGQSAGPQAIDEEQLNQFLQALMVRLQENLSVQVTDTLGQLESEHSAAMAKLTAATELEILELKPTGQIEEMRQLQSRSDQLLANIDSTLQRMFETLQTNIDSYQISLNEGIDNMHSLGRQGEVIVRSLVDHLTQQLGQTAPAEPAFYPNRANTLADATALDSTAIDSTTSGRSPEPAADTVSSLNEILPAGAANVSEFQTDAEVAIAEAPVDSTDAIAQKLVAESAVDDSTSTDEASTENFIREDGTIDLDLLKLDIDRTEDDPSLSRDDLMIDSAAADAQVAAHEADNLEIESKVMPTADAAFLADLTFDDLVVDADRPLEDEASSESEAPSESASSSKDEAPLENEALSRSAERTDDGAEASIPSPVAETLLQVDAPPEPTPEPELAAVLPDLSFHDTPTDETPLQAPEISEPVSSEAAPSESVAATGAISEETTAEGTTAESINEGKPESAVFPDAPDDEQTIDSPLEGPAVSGESIAPNLLAADEIDGVLPDDLLAVIEADNEDAERMAIESVDTDLDALTSDLEEAVVFDAELPALPVLEETNSPLESASIPDIPDGSAVDASGYETIESSTDTVLQTPSSVATTQFPSVDPAEPIGEEPLDPLEASLTNLESSAEGPDVDALPMEESGYEATFEELEDLINDDSPDAELPNADASQSDAVTDLPPADFDDDLDFFQTGAPAADTTPAEENVSPIPEMPSASVATGAAVGLAGAVGIATATDAVSDPAASQEGVEADDASDTQKVDDQDPVDTQGDDDPTNGEPADWFLGIDFGATGLSAVLINQLGEQVYPLCWNIDGDSESNRFRLPTVVQVNANPPNGYQLGQVGPAALEQASPLLRNLKLMVKAGIPDSTASTPWMQWADNAALPLVSLQSAIVELLKTLSPEQMSCQAVGISAGALRRALADLKGVVVGYPTNWPDTYSFNLREAVIAAGLVASPDQVFFVEEVIAALLSALPAPKVANDIAENQQPGLYNCNWSGGTVVISAGAVLTETAVANLPPELDQLSYQDFAMRGYTYAGDGIDQDIICQLLHLPLQAQEGDEPQDSTTGSWAILGLDELTLPQPGEADRVVRHRLRQRLNDSPLGREAVLAARELKVALQEEEEVEVELGDRTWIVTRNDLESKVFLPYIQRINRQVNALLNQKNLAAQNVKQVVCTGGSASLGAIARWLRQKFPNATIIQDTYSGEYSNSCSRVAYGLANLCQYPKVLDSNRHQYNDYFLLLELLRILPEQPLPAGGILHLLEQRGIDTQACQAHILALIEGRLPPGLVPTSGDRPLISAQSSDIATYKGLSDLPLFRKQGGQIYIADPQQGDRLRSHLESLLASKAQSLSEPMTTEAMTAAAVQG